MHRIQRSAKQNGLWVIISVLCMPDLRFLTLSLELSNSYGNPGRKVLRVDHSEADQYYFIIWPCFWSFDMSHRYLLVQNPHLKSIFYNVERPVLIKT